MKVLSYTSGLEPCGIRDYNRHLLEALGDRAERVRFPTRRVTRDRPRELLAYRREYRGLAARADAADAVIVDWVTAFFNGPRPVEHMFPAFAARLRSPAVMILHEWPTVRDLHHYTGRLPVRIAKRALTTAWLAVDARRLDYQRWLERDMFAGFQRILVHTPELRDRLRASGIDAHRVSARPFPLHTPPAPSWTPEETAARFGLTGKRVLLLFGIPAARKGFDLAIQALPVLPHDTVLVLACADQRPAERAQIDELRGVARAAGVADRFVTTGYLDDAGLAALYQITSLGLSPFRSVTGSSSLAHFLAGGVPVVASDLPAIREIHDAGAGISLVPAGDVDALRAAIADVLASPERATTLRAASQRYARGQTFAALAAHVRSLIADAIVEAR